MAAQLDPLPAVNIRKIHLYQCDHRGTPAALINQEGQTEWKAEVDPWGEILSEENPNNIEQPLRLPGQWYDEESGLHYNRHRYYNPAQGRYITQEPIGLKGGWNPYTYPLNPVTNVDPLGLSSLGEVMNIHPSYLSKTRTNYLVCNHSREKDCYAECAHLLPSPSGDLQSSEYRKCYRECTRAL